VEYNIYDFAVEIEHSLELDELRHIPIDFRIAYISEKFTNQQLVMHSFGTAFSLSLFGLYFWAIRRPDKGL
jgi:hypothetical protein